MPDNKTLYRVILTGEPKLGEQPDEVIERLEPVLKLETEKVRRLLSGKPRAVGRPVTRTKAEKILGLLSDAGADCYIEQVNEILPRSIHKGQTTEDSPSPLRPKSQPLGAITEKLAPSAWSLEPVSFGAPATKAPAAKAPANNAGPPPLARAADMDSGLTLAEPAAEDSFLFKKPEHIVCPKCGHEQTPAQICEVCGLVFRKHQAAVNREDVAQAQPPPARALAGRGRAPGKADADLELFIGPNLRTYLDKFDNFRDREAEHFALTWHWPALFVPFFWALYRKLWLWSALMFVSGLVLPLISNVAWALTANYLYFRHARGTTASLRRVYRSGNIDQQIAAAGGTSATAVWIAIVAIVLLQYWAFKAIFAPRSNMVGGITQAVVHQQGNIQTQLTPELARDPSAAKTLGSLNILELGVKMWLVGRAKGRSPDEVTWVEISRDLNLKQQDLADAWDTPIRYEGYPQSFALRSAGPDRLFETGDDITLRSETR